MTTLNHEDVWYIVANYNGYHLLYAFVDDNVKKQIATQVSDVVTDIVDIGICSAIELAGHSMC